jgi:hypothetical protein
MPFAGHRAEVLAFLLIAGFVLATSVRVPPRLVGDGAEYFVVAEALARHASPDLRLGDRESVRQMLDAEGVAGGDRLREVPEVIGRDGRAYGIHFWGYPLLTLPVRFALRRMGTSGLRAPQVTNALLFVAALWPHPEVFSFSLAIAALVWRSTGRRSLAVLAAALASVQNPPLVLLALALSAEAIRDASTKPERKASGLAAPAVCLLPALVPSLFCLWQFGTPSLLTRGAVSSANMSSGRTLELLFDLNVGLLPYAPVVVVGSLCAALRARSRIAAWALALAMGYLCTATCNWNSGTSGPARYAVWMYPLILYVFVSAIRGGTDRDSTTSRGLALLAIVSQGLLVGSRGGMEPRADYLRHSAAARFLLDRWPSAYNPTYEIFVERTRQQEEPFPGPAPILYRFRGECRKALAQKRHLAVLRALCGHDPSNVGELRRRVAREGRALWMYLNYD